MAGVAPGPACAGVVGVAPKARLGKLGAFLALKPRMSDIRAAITAPGPQRPEEG